MLKLVPEAVEQSPSMIALLSKASLASNWVETERHIVWFHKLAGEPRPILPVTIDLDIAVLPPLLRTTIAIQLAGRVTAAAIRELECSIRKAVGK